MERGIGVKKEQLKERIGELDLVDTVFEADGVSYIDTVVSVMQVYDLIDQLDEPEKVVIPKFVADWIEEMKQDERPLYNVMSSLMNKRNHEWAIWKSANMNFSEIVAQAWLDGYEVAKEKLYVVELNNDHLTNYLAYDLVDNVFFISRTQSEILNRYKKKFTEQEIKDYDERFWPFAVEVAE